MGKVDRRRRVATLTRLLASVAMLIGLSAAPSRADRHTSADAARTLKGTEIGRLHLVHAGERLLDEGTATGALPGQMRAELELGSVYTGSFTIYTRNGRISGNGRANPHGSGRYQSFGGSLTVTSGSGLYSHAHGVASLYGVFDRRTYAVLVRITGSLSY